MERTSTFGDIREAWFARTGGAVEPAFEPVARELWLRATDGSPLDAPLGTLEELAVSVLDGGHVPSLAVEKLLGLGRALIEVGEGTDRLDAEGRVRLRTLVDRAVTELVRLLESGRGARRGAWLSFLSHELKNPLNTILNALWLLRERGADAPQAARFLELADRAVRKLEERIRDLKGLDQQLTGLPPGWEGRLFPKRK